MMKFFVCLCLLPLVGAVDRGAMAAPGKPLPGRLFYTPAQREMLVNARTHKVTQIQKSAAPPVAAPMRFDGMIMRSDGVATHWINGRPHVGQPSLHNLKPGQTRAQQQVYEPYQLQRPSELPFKPQTTPLLEHEAAP